MPRVSVIIPTYNRADYLSQALQSVFNQSHTPFEIIVVDDGSTDNTAQVMRDWDAWVRYHRQEHQGISAARNRGLELAQGDVIAWLDADDLWEPDFLASVLPLLEANAEVDGVYTGSVHIDAAGNILPQLNQRVVPPSDLFSSLVEDCFVLTPTVVVRKRCFEQVGQFDPQLGICEDYDMWFRLARNFTIVGLPYPLVRIRVHETNTIKDTSAFCRYRLAFAEKHFGQPEGDPGSWSADKRRAHAHAFSTVALKHIQDGQPDRGWFYLEKAVSIWPNLLGQLNTLYELVIGDQPRGHRGRVNSLDIEANGAEMMHRLDALFVKHWIRLKPVRRVAYGNAYLALGMLSDQARRWGTARRYLFQAIKSNPRLLVSYPVIRRLLKLCAGQRLVTLGSKMLGRTQQATHHTMTCSVQR